MAKSTKPRIRWSVHPGEILAETLAERGMSQADLARQLGVSVRTISRICKGESPIQPKLAIGLERVLGVNRRLWLCMQAAFDNDVVRKVAPIVAAAVVRAVLLHLHGTDFPIG